MLESEESKEPIIDKTLVNKLLKKLKSLLYDELKSVCDAAGFHITDLMPKPRESFIEKGAPSDVENLRFLHFEESRISKILKIASDIASNADSNLYRSPSATALMKQLNITVLSQRPSSRKSSVIGMEAYKSFHKPQDVIQYNYEREKEKYQKSLQMIDKISAIRSTAQKKVDEKLKMFAERDKKLQDEKKKKEEDHEKHTQAQVEKRRQILNKKYQIEESINRQCFEIGILLENRMKQLTERERKILREKMWKKQQKIKARISNDFQKIVMDEIKILAEEDKVKEMMKELQGKLETRLKQYENNVRKKVQTAKSHSAKVEKRFNQFLKGDEVKQAEMLRRIVDKSKVCEEKKDKKEVMTKENAEKLKVEIEKSFDRHSRGVRDINYAELQRLEDIEKRETEKRKTFSVIKSEIQKVYDEKRYKNSARERKHSAKYSKTQQSHVSSKQMKYKEKILQKHHRLSLVAEELKVHKDLLSNLKRRSNYEVQDARSLHSSPAKHRTSSVANVKLEVSQDS